MIRLAPEGWPFLLPAFALTALVAMGAILVPETDSLLETLLWWAAGLMGVLSLFTAFFFRDPVRRRRDADGILLAPADGRIVDITPFEEPSQFVDPATRISIFLSVFNVHIQRTPLTGRVEFKTYKPGTYAVAWKAKASEENEQATVGISSGPHRVMVRQIAGLVARRIVTDPEEGDLVPQGSRLGIIRFGSRVDLFLPRDWELTCRVGDKVKGGLTGMARIPSPAEGGSP